MVKALPTKVFSMSPALAWAPGTAEGCCGDFQEALSLGQRMTLCHGPIT